MNILIVDDDELLHSIVSDKLGSEGFSITSSHNGAKGLEKTRENKFDLILLDILMPGMSGLEFLKKLRISGDDTPVIMLTSLADQEKKLEAFKAGIDDFICKPFYSDELLARIKAVLKRAAPPISDLDGFELGRGYFDFKRHLLLIEGNVLDCKKYEILILKLLITSEGKIISRDEILHHVWGPDKFPSDRTIDNYIVLLRKKIALCVPAISSDTILESVYGSGYRINL